MNLSPTAGQKLLSARVGEPNPTLVQEALDLFRLTSRSTDKTIQTRKIVYTSSPVLE
jgi:hypothetical protein